MAILQKLKIRWLIATRNIDWRQADLTKAEDNNIVVLRDPEIEYYQRLTGLLKKAAKYQLLAHVFSEEKIHEMDIKVPATKGKMGGQTFYNFLIRPFDLLKIAYISHKQSRNIEDIETYQRMLKPGRLSSLARYIDKGGNFPQILSLTLRQEHRCDLNKKNKLVNRHSACCIYQIITHQHG